MGGGAAGCRGLRLGSAVYLIDWRRGGGDNVWLELLENNMNYYAVLGIARNAEDIVITAAHKAIVWHRTSSRPHHSPSETLRKYSDIPILCP